MTDTRVGGKRKDPPATMSTTIKSSVGTTVTPPPKLVAIHAITFVPLYEFVDTIDTGRRTSTRRKTHFGSSDTIIWQDGSTTPVAIAGATATAPDVKLGIHLGNLTHGQAWKFTAAFMLPTGASKTPIPFVSIEGDNWDPGHPIVDVTVIPPKFFEKDAMRPLPWAFKGDLVCTLWVGTAKQPPQTIQIELYVLSKDLPDYWKKSGVSLDLLRVNSLLPAWMLTTGDTTKQQEHWPAFVVETLFKDPKMIYDIWEGQEAYCGMSWRGSFASNSTVLWLDLWLSDMMGIIKRQTNERYAVNCSDTAILVEAIASLGAFGSRTLRSWMLDPFGFIKSTHLIGRHKAATATTYTDDDLCNNPFYGSAPKYSPEMLVAEMDAKRSLFHRHKFVIQTAGDGKSMVLDACAGPRHLLGDTRDAALDGFLAATIDAQAKLYAPNKYTDSSPRPTGPGTRLKVKEADGIRCLAQRPSIVRVFTPTTGSTDTTNLYNNLAWMLEQMVPQGYTIMNPCIGFIEPGSQSLITTWTIRKTATQADLHQGELHVNISRFSSLEQAQENYVARRALLTGYKERDKANYLYFETEQPCFVMFYDSQTVKGKTKDKDKDVTYLITMDGTMTNEALFEGENSLVDRLVSALTFDTNDDVAMKLELPQGAIRIGTTFEVTLKPSDKSKPTWRGAIADSSEGRILHLDTTVAPDGSAITMTFLPLVAGNEFMSFTLFGPNLDEDTQYFKNIIVLPKT